VQGDLLRETEWIEFKHNFWRPEDVGEYISDLAKSAALHQQRAGFVLWGYLIPIKFSSGLRFGHITSAPAMSQRASLLYSLGAQAPRSSIASATSGGCFGFGPALDAVAPRRF
jgi:hypothetical protein